MAADMQHQFYYDKPPACHPKDLPKFQASHEMELKRIRHERDEAKKRQQPQHQQGSQQPDPKRQRYNPGPHAGQQGAYGGQNRGAGRGMAQGGPRAAYPVPPFDPSHRPGMAPPAAAAAGFPPGRHAGMPGAVPRGPVPGGPMQLPYSGPGRGMPVSSAGQAANPAVGAAAYGAQGYVNPAAYGGRGGRGGAPAYPPGFSGNYAGNVAPGGNVSGGYGAYGAAGGHNQLQGGAGRGGAPRPSQPPYQPTTIDRPAWTAQRR